MQKRAKIGIIVAITIVAVVGIVTTIPKKQETKSENTQIAFYYTDENENEIETNTIPEGYILDTYTCNNNNITISWKNDTNKLRITASGAGSCKVYLKQGT